MYKFITLLGLFFGAALFLLKEMQAPMKFESRESKNFLLEPVFNEVRWVQDDGRDIWMMNQSHSGAYSESSKWERLAIVIDKTQKPMVAQFYQVEPGPLEWEDGLRLKKVEFRANCFICHNNGPRAIRPNKESSLAPIDWIGRLKIIWWNWRIKSYGRIVYDSIHDQEDRSRVVPFRYRSPQDDAELKVKACTRCHNSQERGVLLRQQSQTIQFLVEQGEMPPSGSVLNQKDKSLLDDFLKA